MVRGVEPQQLRDNENLRQRVTSQLSGVQSVVDGLLVDRPRRNILRSRPRGVGLMELVISPHGDVHCLYDESLDLSALGPLTIRRASHVEPTVDGQWTADLSPLGGPVLGPFRLRSAVAGRRSPLDRRSLAVDRELTLPSTA